MNELRKYGINPYDDRMHDDIVYTLALIYDLCNKKVSQYLSAYNLTTAKFNLLLAVKYLDDKNGITQVEIGERLVVTAGNITSLVEKLVKEKLITRKTNPKSRRENLIKITEKGSALIESIWDEYNNIIKTTVNLIPNNQQKQLSEILKNWFTKIKGEEENEENNTDSI